MSLTPSERTAAILFQTRKKKAMTQELLVARSGVSIQTIRRAEQGVPVSAESLRAICAALDLDSEEILERASLAVGSEIPDRITVPQDRKDTVNYMGPRPWALLAATGGLIIAAALLVGASPTKLERTLLTLFFPVIWSFDFWLFVIGEGDPASRCPATWLSLYPSRWSAPLQLAGYIAAGTSALIIGNVWVGIFSCFAVFSADKIAYLFCVHKAIQDEKKAMMAATSEFATRIPEILTEIKNQILNQTGVGTAAAVRALAEEAARLAAAANRGRCALPLVYLADDVARGLSPRKSLIRYLDVADALLNPCGQAPGRLGEDAWVEVEAFRRRTSAFA
jgi:transcriptional regulator with XRE-family HTH domain